jgi:hypothetical protein
MLGLKGIKEGGVMRESYKSSGASKARGSGGAGKKSDRGAAAREGVI